MKNKRGSVKVISEHGYIEAMLGLSLSFNTPPYKMEKVATSLCFKGGGHSKFLESMVVWLDCKMPRFWWSEADTYRIGITKQSESTMHSLKRRHVTQDDFYSDIYEPTLDYINKLIKDDADIDIIKNELSDGYLQRRIICTNYMTLQNIIKQRQNHKLKFLWQGVFCQSVINGVEHPEFLYRLN